MDRQYERPFVGTYDRKRCMCIILFTAHTNGSLRWYPRIDYRHRITTMIVNDACVSYYLQLTVTVVYDGTRESFTDTVFLR